MENSRLRGRKRYCCYYCNTYFYQVDSWQRHNRKHTGVEIECDDCGEMCSDHFELKAHQQLCDAYRVYSEDAFIQTPSEAILPSSRNNSSSGRPNENTSVHETPDSTSKQESLPDDENSTEGNAIDQIERSSVDIEKSGEKDDIAETERDLSKSSELDYLIGEDQGQNIAQEEGDAETEALIGIDQNEVSQMKENDVKQSASNVGVDTQIVIKVDSALNAVKQNHMPSTSGKENIEIPTFYSRPSPLGASMSSTQAMSIDSSDMNKKYQPYFCKNCGARFTRKDSVTRHLKKGTCSGKSAIVCNICGKVFSEMFELQGHFKMEHKNIAFTPAIVHRSILPRIENHEQSLYSHYPTHYVVNEQHIARVSRPFIPPEQTYRPMPPGLQTMFYGNQPSFVPPPSHPSATGHYHERMVQPRAMELKYSPTGHVRKDITFVNNSGKLMVTRGNEVSRKREYSDSQTKVMYVDSESLRKNRKIETDFSSKQLSPKYRGEKFSRGNESINLSEYTNNAMSSKQYYDNRFLNPEASAGKDEPPRAHQCKVCGLEFPRFEYLLTHLRKHKEKNEVAEPGDEHDIDQHVHRNNFSKDTINYHVDEYQRSKVSVSDSSSSDDNDHTHPKYVTSQMKGKECYQTSHGPATIQPPQNVYPPPASSSEQYTQQRDLAYPLQSNQVISNPLLTSDGTVEAITPGVDGKFRPFICENCGQRFTRKDSLVRHAKKQTCFEELVDLKCKHCDKAFRYHKCLMQHQELVHGIQQEEYKPGNSDDELSESDGSDKNDVDVPKENRHTEEKNEDKFQTHQNKDKVSTSSDHPRIKPVSQFHPFVRDNHFPSQAIPSTHHLGPSSNQLLLKSDDMTKIHQGNEANTQDAQYIGYCMLPRPFKCEYCGDRFAHRHSLKRHVRRHLGIGIPCHDCGKLYRDQSEWRRHQRSIHNRHYEKYEVPSRMSFRDGVEQGLIGVVPKLEYDAQNEHDESDSEKSEDDLSMAKIRPSYIEVKKHQSDPLPKVSSSDCRPNSSDCHKSKPEDEANEANKSSDTSSVVAKEEKLKAFDFKAHSAIDKDSRKSLLDLYLCSPNSGDEGGDNHK